MYFLCLAQRNVGMVLVLVLFVLGADGEWVEIEELTGFKRNFTSALTLTISTASKKGICQGGIRGHVYVTL